MQKGFSVPSLLILIAILVALPVFMWGLSSASSTSDVKGTSTDKPRSGIDVFIKSNSGSWSLSQYLCESVSACLSSLESGERISVASGGVTSNQVINIPKTPETTKAPYLKIFVRSAWGSPFRQFSILNTGSLSEPLKKDILVGSDVYAVLVFPTSNFTQGHLLGPTFQD